MDKDHSFTGYRFYLKDNARALRKNMTKFEKKLWFCFLKDYPVKFYRQRVIDDYIVDFYCPKAKLVIEVDGSQHYTDNGLINDSIRTDILEKYGLTVLRYTNRYITKRFDLVIESIDTEIRKRINNAPRP